MCGLWKILVLINHEISCQVSRFFIRTTTTTTFEFPPQNAGYKVHQRFGQQDVLLVKQ